MHKTKITVLIFYFMMILVPQAFAYTLIDSYTLPYTYLGEPLQSITSSNHIPRYYMNNISRLEFSGNLTSLSTDYPHSGNMPVYFYSGSNYLGYGSIAWQVSTTVFGSTPKAQGTFSINIDFVIRDNINGATMYKDNSSASDGRIDNYLGLRGWQGSPNATKSQIYFYGPGSIPIGGDYNLYTGTSEIEPPVCDFEITPYPADPGTVITLTDTSTGGEPSGYGWGYQIPGGTWDNTSLGIGQTAAYTLAYFGQYNFSHEVGNAAGTDTCWYPFWSGTNYTAWNVTPTLIGNLTTNITAQNISGQFAPLNLTLIDKPFFKSQLDNMTYFGNYSRAWTGFIDNMTESVNVTFNEVEDRINPFNFLTDLIMNSHNLFVIIFIPLLGYVSFPLVITSAVINIIPEPVQLLISLGLLVDLFFLVLRGPD